MSKTQFLTLFFDHPLYWMFSEYSIDCQAQSKLKIKLAAASSQLSFAELALVLIDSAAHPITCESKTWFQNSYIYA